MSYLIMGVSRPIFKYRWAKKSDAEKFLKWCGTGPTEVTNNFVKKFTVRESNDAVNVKEK